VTDAEVIDQYGRLIWEAFERERDADRRRCVWEIDTIIEAVGLPPFDWNHSPESLQDFAMREMPTEEARTAMLKRCDRLEELSALSIELYNQTDRFRRSAARKGT
jgi:hypothetical protein